MLFIIINPVNFNLWPSPLALLTSLPWRARFSVGGEVVAWVMRLEKSIWNLFFFVVSETLEKNHQRSQDVSALGPVKQDAQSGGEWCFCWQKSGDVNVCLWDFHKASVEVFQSDPAHVAVQKSCRCGQWLYWHLLLRCLSFMSSRGEWEQQLRLQPQPNQTIIVLPGPIDDF